MLHSTLNEKDISNNIAGSWVSYFEEIQMTKDFQCISSNFKAINPNQ